MTTRAMMHPTTARTTGHRRVASTPVQVKETLNAMTEESIDGERTLNQYILKETVGQGAYGLVQLAIDKRTGDKYAIKVFSKSRLRKRDKDIFRRSMRGWRGLRGRGGSPMGVGHEESSNPLYLIRGEVAVLKKLNHVNVVKLYEVLDDPENDLLYMVFEMCEKGVLMDVSLNKKTKAFSEEEARRHFREMILGFEYLHENDIVHRDIKPDNLLLSKDDVLKIVDFGVSEIFVKGNDMTTKSAGSPAFMAPELCVPRHGAVSGKATDIWSMGVTLYCLNFGCLPFEKDNLVDLYKSINNDKFEVPQGTDADLVDLLTRLLEKDPTRRIAMKELREHPWVTERGTCPLITTAENCSTMVGEITEEEYRSAIKGIASIVTVMQAVSKFKRGSRTYMAHSAEATAIRNDVGEDDTPSDAPQTTITVDDSEELAADMQNLSVEDKPASQ